MRQPGSLPRCGSDRAVGGGTEARGTSVAAPSEPAGEHGNVWVYAGRVKGPRRDSRS
jgi:hypothetical protein